MIKHKGLISALIVTALAGFVSSCSQPVEVEQTTPETPVLTVSDPYQVDITEYRLYIYGLVENPLTLTYESIQEYPTVARTAELWCDLEFLSDSEWTGIAASTLMTEAGVKPEAQTAVVRAIDGYAVNFDLSEFTVHGILAYLENGEPLISQEGYPLKLVMPYYNGADWVRWVNAIEIK